MKLFFLLFIASLQCVAQDTVMVAVKKQRHRFPIWTYHQNNVTTHGVSLGLGSLGEAENSNTNGVKIELIGAGILIPMASQSPIAQDDDVFNKQLKNPISEKVNGLVISALGTICGTCKTNGLVMGGIGNYNHKVNGVVLSIMMNFTNVSNGAQISFITNESYKTNGLQIGGRNHSYYTNGVQIGLYNISKHLRGFQFGLWNVNEKRRLPLINWYFGKDKKVKS